MRKEKILEKYKLIADEVPADIKIISDPLKYLPFYKIEYPMVGPATKKILEEVKTRLIEHIVLTDVEHMDPRTVARIQSQFKEEAIKQLKSLFPNVEEKDISALTGHLVHDMLGLGHIEMLLNDHNLEEIVINNAREDVQIYHKKWGWLTTNVKVPNEKKIYEYSQTIARKVGRQITSLNPLLDAHLLTGDRVNATLNPISTKGNTITIRKFSRDPWTVVDFIRNNTLTKEVAALMWACIQYEMNIIVSGGTGSGKTSLLNSLTPFFPANQRIISIEDTRELNLPEFLHWVPLTTRLPNPEGKGEVTMLDLMINSLRMRPDRILVGEIRREKEAEVLFEAMHTGHSVYATLHADNAAQTYRRLVNPPINVPPSMLEAVHLIVVQFRHRRKGIRRTYEVVEVIPSGESSEEVTIRLNLLYRWKSTKDTVEAERPSLRLLNELKANTGFSDKEINNDMLKKQEILQWMVDQDVHKITPVGKVISEYYKDPEFILDAVKRGKKPDFLTK